MQYTVLARKYRPQQFDDLVGQEHISRTLKNAIAHKRVAHAYLFVGPRGIGKTSTARILAKALVCEEGPTETPCGVCASCREVAAGTNLDVLEIDGASNRGIDEVRAIRDNVRYSPARAPFKLYIIDEVHQITRDAFNALLKTLEEPPPHVKFFFATTEPHKVPTTILSRCQRFDLRRIPTPAIAKRLNEIAEAENISAEPAALQAIARAADGGMRDALSTLDQLIAFCGENIREEDVLAAHGLASRDQLLELAQSTLSASIEDAFTVIQDSYQAGRDLHRIILDMVLLFRDLVVVKASNRPSGLVDLTENELNRLQPLIADVSLDRLVRILDLFSSAEGRLRQVISHRALLEMTIIKAAQIATQPSINEVLSLVQKMRENGPDFRLGGSDRPISNSAEKPRGLQREAPQPPPPPELVEEQQPVVQEEQSSSISPSPEQDDSPVNATGPTSEQDVQAESSAPSSNVSSEEPSQPAEEEADETAVHPSGQISSRTPLQPAPSGDGPTLIPLDDTHKIWDALLRRVEGSFVLRSILFSGQPVGLQPDGSWLIEFPPESEALSELESKPEYLLLIGRFLERFSGTKATVVGRPVGQAQAVVSGAREEGPTETLSRPQDGIDSSDGHMEKQEEPVDEPMMDSGAQADSMAIESETSLEEPVQEEWSLQDGPDTADTEEDARNTGSEAIQETASTEASFKNTWAARAAEAMKRKNGDPDRSLSEAFERMSKRLDENSAPANPVDGQERAVPSEEGDSERMEGLEASGEDPRRRFRSGLKKFESDPHIQSALKAFGGRLIEIQR